MKFVTDDKKFNEEYQEQLERNWRKWKGKGKKRLEMIIKEEEKKERIEERIEKQDKEDEMGKIRDIYNEL